MKGRTRVASAVTVLTPIVPGQEQPLRHYLEGLRAGARSPLARLSSTHFARWVIVPDFVRDPRQPVPDHLGCQYLLFTASVDGTPHDYLYELSAELGPEAAEIWGRCVGCPEPAAGEPLRAYLGHNHIDTGFFFAAYRKASVAHVRRSLDVRDRLIRFAVSAQSLDVASVHRAFLEEFSR